MYSIEKSSRNADTTRIADAKNTAANAAMPARRAVSERRSAASPLFSKATTPTTNEYAQSTNAIRRARLPSSAMITNGYFFRNGVQRQLGWTRRRTPVVWNLHQLTTEKR